MILHLQVFGNGRSRWWSWWLSWWFAASCWCWSRRKATERESRSSGLFDGLDLDIKETLKTVKSTVIKKHKLFSSTFPTAHLLSCLPHRWQARIFFLPPIPQKRIKLTSVQLHLFWWTLIKVALLTELPRHKPPTWKKQIQSERKWEDHSSPGEQKA